MDIKEIKIIGVQAVGSYESWSKWSIASIYNLCNLIIVVNGGWVVRKPELGNNNILERTKNQLKEIDVHNKILQFRPNQNNLEKSGLFDSKKDELGRASNMTLSFLHAYKYALDSGWDLNKTYCLKLDADQIAHTDFSRQKLESLIDDPSHIGYRFKQWADFHRFYDRCNSLCHYCADGTLTNDGSLFFKVDRMNKAGGQGSPGVIEEYPHEQMSTFHMRNIAPPDVDEYKYFYDRSYYHVQGPNSIMEHDYNRKTGQFMNEKQIAQKAKEWAEGIIGSEGHIKEYFNNDKRFPPCVPKVIELGCKEYIKRGLPNA